MPLVQDSGASMGVRPYVIHASHDVSYAKRRTLRSVLGRSLQARELQQATTPPVLIASQCCRDRSGRRDFQMSFLDLSDLQKGAKTSAKFLKNENDPATRATII